MGEFGDWTASLIGGEGSVTKGPPSLSFRNPRFEPGMRSAVAWRQEAKQKLRESLLLPELGPIRQAATSSVRQKRTYTVGDLRVEEIE